MEVNKSSQSNQFKWCDHYESGNEWIDVSSVMKEADPFALYNV